MNEDKRRFQRIPFDAEVKVYIDNHPPLIGVLQDISLKGALIAVSPNDTMPLVQSSCDITINTTQGDLIIELSAQVSYVHAKLHTFGVNITKLEIESASHLRRLVEVNLGSEEALQRELSNLISAMESEHN
jgi:hypothetical protein